MVMCHHGHVMTTTGSPVWHNAQAEPIAGGDGIDGAANAGSTVREAKGGGAVSDGGLFRCSGAQVICIFQRDVPRSCAAVCRGT